MYCLYNLHNARHLFVSKTDLVGGRRFASPGLGDHGGAVASVGGVDSSPMPLDRSRLAWPLGVVGMGL